MNEEAFTFLAAGQSLEFSVDIAADHSLDAGGVYSVFAQGAIPYAAANTTTLVGAAQVESDTLDMEVDGVEASKVLKSIVDKRSAVQSDCTGSQRTATVNALANCATLARTAASNAQSSSGSNPYVAMLLTSRLKDVALTKPRFLTYFDTSSNSGTVTSCLNAIATECSSSTSGTTRTYCTDVYRACASNVLAYTVPSLSIIVNCPLYFSYLPALSRTCHAQDQATTTLHEVAHSNCGADDLAYGYSASVALSSSNSPRNADNYALYANGKPRDPSSPGNGKADTCEFSSLCWLLSDPALWWRIMRAGGNLKWLVGDG